MKGFGVCCGPEQVAEVLAAGFDYAETGARNLLEKGVSFEGVKTTNLFFPWEICLYDGSFDVGTYVRELVSRASEERVELMVIGSGGARKSVPGWPVAACEKRFTELMGEAAAIGREFGVTIAPEALRKEETDVFNSTFSLAESMAAVGCAWTMDTFHYLVGEDKRLPGSTPDHFHLSSVTRQLPAVDDAGVLRLVGWAKARGFDGRVSFEGEWPEGGLAEILGVIREIWGEV